MAEKEYSLSNIVPVGTGSIYTSGSALLIPQLLQSLLESSDKVLSTVSVSGVLTQDLTTLQQLFVKNGGRLIVSKPNSGDYVFVWKDHSFISIDFTVKSKTISISGYVVDQELVKLCELVEKDFVSKLKTNLIFSIIRNSYGLTISSMGDGSSPLIKENYLPEVLNDVDYVISAFTKNPPGGRICILNGEPGTGKTHLIRSILTRMDCVFLIVPSNLIDSLDKPEFMPLLINVKNDHDKPIIMIIEDGDACLVPRKSDNISTISSLLNLSDGILGSIIDIKMIISTNADIKEMDQAIMRPGRLCRNIHVGSLPYEQAQKVYERLMNSTEAKLAYSKYYTLAQIYDIVNNADTIFTNKSAMSSKRSIGFSYSNDLTVNSSKLDVK